MEEAKKSAGSIPALVRPLEEEVSRGEDRLGSDAGLERRGFSQALECRRDSLHGCDQDFRSLCRSQGIRALARGDVHVRQPAFQVEIDLPVCVTHGSLLISVITRAMTDGMEQS